MYKAAGAFHLGAHLKALLATREVPESVGIGSQLGPGFVNSVCLATKEAAFQSFGLRYREAMPTESQCPHCGYFDIAHPDVIRIMGDELMEAGCTCKEGGGSDPGRARLAGAE